jgi:hypothetical protein
MLTASGGIVEGDFSMKLVGGLVTRRPAGVDCRDDLARIGLVDPHETAAVEEAT